MRSAHSAAGVQGSSREFHCGEKARDWIGGKRNEDTESKVVIRPWGQRPWRELACYAKAFGFYFLDRGSPRNRHHLRVTYRIA